jgi:hypothetical protein
LQLCTSVHMADVPPTVRSFLWFLLSLKASYVDIAF